MIDSREKLRQVLYKEKGLYIGYGKSSFIHHIMKTEDYRIWKYIKALRISEYYFNKGDKLRYYYFQRKKNKLGSILGISIWRNNVDEGLRIWHYGSVIINGNCNIGKNCQLHGQNCLGNKGGIEDKAPKIGDNVDIGIGAKIIGDVYIANNVKIGANAVVTKSCYEEGATLVGIPAIKRD